jgi:hypothetical protein
MEKKVKDLHRSFFVKCTSLSRHGTKDSFEYFNRPIHNTPLLSVCRRKGSKQGGDL